MPLISSCSSSLPIGVADDCQSDVAVGGFNRLIIATPDVEFDSSSNPITDYTNWKTFADNRKIMISPLLANGEHPEPEVNTTRKNACGTDVAFNKTHTFQGYSNYVDATNRSEWDFWNELDQKYANLLIGIVGCDGYLYLPYVESGISKPGFSNIGGNGVSLMKPTTADEESRYMFNFTFKYSNLLPLVKVDNFLDAFAESPIS
jgi:hypothetical protein